MIIKSLESFKNVFSKRLYDKLIKETLIPYDNITKVEYNKTIEKLYEEIINNEYEISPIREYLYVYKNNDIARISPILNYKDELLYYFILKILEEEIANNRVEGTFGGWTLGNPIRKAEEVEIEYVSNSFDPSLWNKNWKEFSNLAWTNIKNGNYQYAIKLDIANFYDNINLNILEKKILLAINGEEKFEIVKLLIYLLKYWNKKIDKYDFKTIGLPQNEFGDQSRLLANFYLQDYDYAIKSVCGNNAKYLRYSDDHIIFFNENSDLNLILYNICKELNKIGLNINAGKVHKFNLKELEVYYGYEILDLIDNEKYKEAEDIFLKYVKENRYFRSDIILKRFLNVGLDKFIKRKEIINLLIEKNHIKENSNFYIEQLYRNANKEEKAIILKIIDELIDETYYNAFHYSILKFSKKNKLKKLEIKVMEKIESIKTL